MNYRYFTLDVFTDRIFGGNPLAVFPAADGLSSRQMQLIAREFNLSETVFICTSRYAECKNRLRIFSPKTEMPFAGHPIVGSSFLLAYIGMITPEQDEVFFDCNVGHVKVKIQFRKKDPVFVHVHSAIEPEIVTDVPSRETLASVLSLSPDMFSTEFPIAAASCGAPFMLLPLKSRQAVIKAQLNSVDWQAYVSNHWAANLYLYTTESVLPSSQLHARCFAPAVGIAEDPATGSAAMALGSFLAQHSKKTDKKFKWIIEQGFEMERPSFLEVEAEKIAGKLNQIKIGGTSVIVSEGDMEVPADM